MRETTRDLIKDIAVSSVGAIAAVLIFDVLLGLDDLRESGQRITKETTKEVGGANNGSSC